MNDPLARIDEWLATRERQLADRLAECRGHVDAIDTQFQQVCEMHDSLKLQIRSNSRQGWNAAQMRRSLDFCNTLSRLRQEIDGQRTQAMAVEQQARVALVHEIARRKGVSNVVEHRLALRRRVITRRQRQA